MGKISSQMPFLKLKFNYFNGTCLIQRIDMDREMKVVSEVSTEK